MGETSGVKGGAVAVLIGAGGLVAGSFLPWVTVQSVFGEQSVTGIDKDGKITAIAGAIIGLLILTSMAHRTKGVLIASALVAAAGAATAIYDWRNVSNAVDDFSNDYARAGVGYGLYLCAAGGIVAFVGACVAGDTPPQPAANLSGHVGFAPVPMMTAPAGWLPDPSGRHQFRHWDGQAWTEHVSNGGVVSVDAG